MLCIILDTFPIVVHQKNEQFLDDAEIEVGMVLQSVENMVRKRLELVWMERKKIRRTKSKKDQKNQI